MNNPYSQDKSTLHADRISLLRVGIQPYPVHVQIVISDLCNQDCNFCAYRMSNYTNNELFHIIGQDGVVDNNPRRFIPWEKLQEIVDDCVSMKVRAIQVTGGGEPTVHKHFDEFCQLVMSKGIDLAVVTNGLLVNERRAKLLSGATWVRFSIDASNAETYSKIRQIKPVEFNIVAENIKRLAAISDRKVTLGVGFVVTRDNYMEIEDACRLYKSWGVDNVRLSGFFQNDGSKYYDGILEEAKYFAYRATELTDSKFTVYNNFYDRLADLDVGSPKDKECGYMHLTTYIGGDQNVYTCCINAYSTNGIIGSLTTQRFKDLWDGQEKQSMFNCFDARNCERCMFHQKNRNIKRIVDEPKGHDNFI